MPEYEPFPLAPKTAELIKKAYKLSSVEEATQPRIIRDFFDRAAASQITPPEVEKEEKDIEMNGIKVNISIIRPVGTKGKVLPTVLFLHGGGWVCGSYNTHGILSNELANVVQCAIIFVNYSLSPEVKYPVALEECYAALCWVQKNGASIHVDPKRLSIAGDSAGGNLCIALTYHAKKLGNNEISSQILFYPVTGVDFNTESYLQNQNNAFLSRKTMMYVWKAYIDSTDQHKDPHIVPLAAPADLLAGLPPALVITAENDVLRDEGEAYGKMLIEAGVESTTVRYFGVGHGFLTLPTITPQGAQAIAQASSIMKKHWTSPSKL